MAYTYVKIASVAVGAGGAASIDFASIPSTYTDLLVTVSARSSGAVTQASCYVYFNNDTSSIYTYRWLQGSGTAAGSASYTNVAIDFTQVPGASATANTFSNSQIYIPNYSGSNNKTVSADATQENNAATAYVQIVAGLWPSSSAINRVTLNQFSAANFVQYSTATLYGIVKS